MISKNSKIGEEMASSSNPSAHVASATETDTLSDLDLVRELRSAADASNMMAEAAKAIAAHFRPSYEACWEGGPGVGRLIEADTVLRLRPYVIEKEAEAKSWLNDQALLNRAADRIAAIAEVEGQR